MGYLQNTGRPASRIKLSLTHVNEAFNEEIQADFVTCHIRGETFEILNVVDMGTKYGERKMEPTRTADRMNELLETEWIFHHGATRMFSADSEFCKPIISTFLESHNIQLNSRPSRSSHKNEIV